jgi:hypothetical protein
MKTFMFKYTYFTANEGPVRIQYKCLVHIYIFPEMKLLFPKQNYNVLSPAVSTLIYLLEIHIFPGSVCLFWCREICGPIPETETAQFPEKEYINGIFLAV